MNKRIFLKITIVIIAYTCLFFIYNRKVLAADFTADYNISYNLATNGLATVDYNVKLTNLTSNSIATTYTLATGHNDITNVRSFNSITQLPTTVTNDNGTSDIVTTIYDNPGKGNLTQWTIEYQTRQVASHLGNLWNIVIPGILKKDIINNVAVTLVVPTSFGAPNYLSVANTKGTTSNGFSTYNFTDSNAVQNGILVSFGDYQIYNFAYSYQLNNTSYTDNESFNITVPPDTNTQSIYFTKITPTPTSVKKDQDDNYIVTYIVPPRTNEVSVIDGYSKVYSNPNLLQTPLAKPVNLSIADLKLYTDKQSYWQVNDSKIQQLVSKLTMGKTSVNDKEFAIFNYVATTLHYNKDQVYVSNRSRMGAVDALANPNNVICQEYADLFVTLSRAAGIPSRMVAGYAEPAITTIQQLPPNVLHAWAQYYDPSFGWVDVDPTWQSTSGGLDYFGDVGSSHFTLAIYGANSTNPPLVLAFTSNQDTSKSIVIKSQGTAITESDSVKIYNTSENVTSGFPNNLNVTVQNTGNRVVYVSNMTVKGSNDVKIGKINFNSKQPILPGEKYNTTVGIQDSNFMYSGTKDIIVNAKISTISNNLIQTQQLFILFSPFILLQYIPWIVTILIFVLSLGLVKLIISLYHRTAKK